MLASGMLQHGAAERGGYIKRNQNEGSLTARKYFSRIHILEVERRMETETSRQPKGQTVQKNQRDSVQETGSR